MKNNYSFSLTFMILLMCVLPSMAAQLNGTYTINPLLPASASNFQNIRSAVTYLTSATARADGGPVNASPFGVSGPVTFEIASGTFTEQVTVPAITGSSVTNNIVFKGAGQSSTIFTFSSADNANRHTLKLNLATNVTFRDMTIRATGSVGWVVHIMGLNSNNNKIKNCKVEITGTGATATGTTYAGIVINNSATSATTGTRIDGSEIDSNTISAGYYGVIAVGASGNLHVGTKIRNNTFNSQYYYGTYLNYQNGIELTYNNIYVRATNTTTMGIYLLNSTCTGANRHIIANNRIPRFGQYAIYITSSNNISGNKGFIFNNILGGNSTYEYGRTLALSNSSQWSVSFNTANFKGIANSNTYGACYINAGTGISLINNVFAVTQNTVGLPLYASTSLVFDTMNYNTFYRSDTSNNQLVYLGAAYNSGNYKGVGGFNANSMADNPMFANDTILTLGNSCLRGVSYNSTPVDFWGTTRSITNPSMGAIEAVPLSDNMQVLGYSFSTSPLVAGYTDLKVLMRNSGGNAVTSFNLSYTQNGGLPTPTSWFGSLAPCDTVTVSFSGAQQINIGNSNNIVIYSDAPNGFVDTDKNNDTLKVIAFLPLSGNYNIGGTTPDFASLSQAIASATSAGIVGAVTFTVNTGTYVDQVLMETAIPGLDSVKTITIQGIHQDSSIILHNNSFVQRPVFRIGVSNVTIKDLTIKSDNSTNAWGVHISKTGLKNIVVKNCNIHLAHPNAVNATSDFFAGVVMCGSSTSLYYSPEFILNNIMIDSNTITNGYVGVYHYSYYYSYYSTAIPSKNVFIRNNKVNNQYYYGINVTFADGLNITSNTINMNPINASSYGIYLYYNNATQDRRNIINNNKIKNSGYSGIYSYNLTNPTSYRGSFTNNEIAGGFKSTNPYPVNFSTTTNMDMYHNSVVHDVITTSTTAAAFYFNSGSGNTLKNNHFFVAKTTSTAAPVYISPATAFTQMNYNNLYKDVTAGNYAYIGSWYTKTSFIGALGLNINSTTTNPQFPSDTLLIPGNACINGDTAVVSVVPTDINFIMRSSVPDIGAYEIPTLSNDAGPLTISQPTFPVASGLQDVVVKFTNMGGNIINSLNVSYQTIGNAPVVGLWVGSLAPCGVDSFIHTGANQLNITPGVVYDLKAFTSMPNGLIDSNATNDSLIKKVATPMRGDYIIGNTPSDYLTINDARTALEVRGVDSAVTFKLKAGIYTEQIQFVEIPGASATNTITFTSLDDNPDSVNIRFNSPSNNNYIVRIFGANYFNFNKLTFQSQNITYARVIEFMSSTKSVNITNNKFIAPTTTSTSNLSTIIFSTGNNISDITITNNNFTAGAYAVYLSGISTVSLINNIVVDSNTFTNQYTYGAYMYYTSNFKFRNNNINTVTAGTYVGLLCYYGDSSLEIIRNRLQITGSAGGSGIRTYYCDGFGLARGIIANNTIVVSFASTSAASYGLEDRYASNIQIYHNTVSSTAPYATSYAAYFYYSSATYQGNVIANNIFAHNGAGYAVYHYNPLYSNSDYNLLHTNGTLLAQKGTPAATYANINAAKTGFANSYEVNSIQSKPGFTSNTNVTPNLNDSNLWATNGRGKFVPNNLLTDINGNPRSNSVSTGAPDIGALEITPLSQPVLCVATPTTPVAGGTQIFTIGSDTVCTITYDALSTAPTAVGVRQYTGVMAPNVTSSHLATSFYLHVEAPPGFYNYTINMYYKNDWLGTNPSETNLRMAKTNTLNNWVWYTGAFSSVDSIRNILTCSNLNEFSYFTGTDDISPLPVNLLSFTGNIRNNDAILNWQTASERNTAEFVLERSLNTTNFERVTSIRAAKNSNSLKKYNYIDADVFNRNNSAYYRLKMIDVDGKFTYSNVVALNKGTTVSTPTVYPNPFRDNLLLQHAQAGKTVHVFNIAGKQIITIDVKQDGDVTLSELNALTAGIYFIKIDNTTIKVVKE